MLLLTMFFADRGDLSYIIYNMRVYCCRELLPASAGNMLHTPVKNSASIRYVDLVCVDIYSYSDPNWFLVVCKCMCFVYLDLLIFKGSQINNQ